MTPEQFKFFKKHTQAVVIALGSITGLLFLILMKLQGAQMGLVMNPLLIGSGRKSIGLVVLCALVSLVLPGLIMYLVPSVFHGVLVMGLMVSMVAYSAKFGLGAVVIIYLALVTVTWEAIRLAIKRYWRQNAVPRSIRKVAQTIVSAFSFI